MPGHMHTKGSLFPLWLDLGMLDEQCPGVLGTVLGYRDNKVEELALPEFTMWMHDRHQRTLGTTGPSPVILMTRKLRTNKVNGLLETEMELSPGLQTTSLECSCDNANMDEVRGGHITEMHWNRSVETCLPLYFSDYSTLQFTKNDDLNSELHGQRLILFCSLQYLLHVE